MEWSEEMWSKYFEIKVRTVNLQNRSNSFLFTETGTWPYLMIESFMKEARVRSQDKEHVTESRIMFWDFIAYRTPGSLMETLTESYLSKMKEEFVVKYREQRPIGKRMMRPRYHGRCQI